jgi:hypothetical protein
MAPILTFCRRFRGDQRSFGIHACVLLWMAIGMFASCHPPQSKENQTVQSAHLSAKDALLAEQFPMREDLQAQQELLYKHSNPAKKVIVPDRKHLEGNFAHGAIELIFDEIDGEPNYLYAHLEASNPEQKLAFIIYEIPNAQLDKLVPGQKYRVHWIETVVNTEPFDDDRYREFLTYRIDKL